MGPVVAGYSRPPIEVKGPLYTPLLTVGLRLFAGGILGSPLVMKPFFTMWLPVGRRDASGRPFFLPYYVSRNIVLA